MNIFQ